MSILKWALIMAIVSVLAGLLGFYGLAETSADVARFLFVVIFLVLLVIGLMGARAVRDP